LKLKLRIDLVGTVDPLETVSDVRPLGVMNRGDVKLEHRRTDLHGCRTGKIHGIVEETALVGGIAVKDVDTGSHDTVGGEAGSNPLNGRFVLEEQVHRCSVHIADREFSIDDQDSGRRPFDRGLKGRHLELSAPSLLVGQASLVERCL
jgi:hypothetical protein